MTNSIGSANTIATQPIGTYIVAQRSSTNNVVASDWTGVKNIASTTNIPDCNGVTQAEIRAIVGGTNTIILDSSVTNNY